MDELATTITAILGIFALSFFSFWTAIPAGLALGLSPLVVIATTTLSYAAGTALILYPGERIRAWVMKRYGDKAPDFQNSDHIIWRAWRRFGVIGFGFLAPMTVGAQIGAVIGLTLQLSHWRLFIWMVLGALAWAILLTVLVLLGVAGVEAVT